MLGRERETETYIYICRVYGIYNIIPVMENRMEKKMENETDAGSLQWVHWVQGFKHFGVIVWESL